MRENRSTPRERGFITAAAARARGDGVADLLRHVHAHPRDVLAVSLLLPTIAFSGATLELDDAWRLVVDLESEYCNSWWHDRLLGFARQEAGRFDEALPLALRALEAEPAAGHAVHARTHVHYQTGDHARGLQWINAWIERWNSQTLCPAHFAWHAGLHELALGDLPAARTRYFDQLCTRQVRCIRAQVDSASFLWRAHLAGDWASELLAQKLIAAVEPALIRRPPNGFVAFHAAFALAAAGDPVGLAELADGGPDHEIIATLARVWERWWTGARPTRWPASAASRRRSSGSVAARSNEASSPRPSPRWCHVPHSRNRLLEILARLAAAARRPGRMKLVRTCALRTADRRRPTSAAPPCPRLGAPNRDEESDRMDRRAILSLTAAAVLTLGIGACGNSDSPDDGPAVVRAAALLPDIGGILGPKPPPAAPPMAKVAPAPPTHFRMTGPAFTIDADVCQMENVRPLDPPGDQKQTVCWVREGFGVPPASPSTGTSYILGHAWASQRLVFNPLSELAMQHVDMSRPVLENGVPTFPTDVLNGYTIVLNSPTGTLTYTVTRTIAVDKSLAGDVDTVMDEAIPNRITLITCGVKDGKDAPVNVITDAYLTSATAP